MIHRSAPDRSMRLEVVVMKPRNSPNSTTINTTANTIPVRVTPNRTLSCIKFRQDRIDIRLLVNRLIGLRAFRIQNQTPNDQVHYGFAHGSVIQRLRIGVRIAVPRKRRHGLQHEASCGRRVEAGRKMTLFDS